MATFLFWSPGALAEQPSAPAATESRAVLADWRLNLGAGWFAGDGLEGGVSLSLLTTFRVHFIEGGLLLDGGSEIFGGSYGFAGAALGPVWQARNGARLELLGLIGQNAYSGVGCGLFCRSGGASADFAWAGARAGASYVFGRRKRGHFELGGAMTMGMDLGREDVTYTTVGTGLFSSEETSSSDTMTLGGDRVSFVVVLGGAVDL